MYRCLRRQATPTTPRIAAERPERHDTAIGEGFATQSADIHSGSAPAAGPPEPCMQASETARRADLLERATLVLNRSWQPVHVTTVRRALCMVFREAARIVCPETLATYDFGGWIEQPILPKAQTIRSPSVRIVAPEVVLLARYNRVPCHEAPFTRRNLFLRDDYTCQYCGKRSATNLLSIDHVQPRSRGGSTDWENCVLACVGCNARKADQTLREAGLKLLRTPARPRWTPYLNLSPGQRMDSWAKFTPEHRRRHRDN